MISQRPQPLQGDSPFAKVPEITAIECESSKMPRIVLLHIVVTNGPTGGACRPCDAVRNRVPKCGHPAGLGLCNSSADAMVASCRAATEIARLSVRVGEQNVRQNANGLESLAKNVSDITTCYFLSGCNLTKLYFGLGWMRGA